MKIILLRHEDRENDLSFHSKLTDRGIFNSCNLASKLKKENIDIIFVSPFIRVLQTIFPFCNIESKKVNIELGLYEYLHNPYFLITKWLYNTNEIKDIDLKSIINFNYESIVGDKDLMVLENEINLEKRIKKFFDFLFENYKDKTILLVTHKGVINKIKDIFVEETDMDKNFEMGKYIILQQKDYLQHNNP